MGNIYKRIYIYIDVERTRCETHAPSHFSKSGFSSTFPGVYTAPQPPPYRGRDHSKTSTPFSLHVGLVPELVLGHVPGLVVLAVGPGPVPEPELVVGSVVAVPA